MVLPSLYNGFDAIRVEISTAENATKRYLLHPEVAALVHEMQDYSPDDRHIPDRIAALYKAFAYLGGVQGSSMRDARFAPTKQDEPRWKTREF